jgi:hypothetical protein
MKIKSKAKQFAYLYLQPCSSTVSGGSQEEKIADISETSRILRSIIIVLDSPGMAVKIPGSEKHIQA